MSGNPGAARRREEEGKGQEGGGGEETKRRKGCGRGEGKMEERGGKEDKVGSSPTLEEGEKREGENVQGACTGKGKRSLR